MLTKVQKWGNSQGLRFPKTILEEVLIEVGDEVELIVEDGAIIVRPTKGVRGKYDLDDLVSRMSKSYKPVEDNWGAPEGNEVW